jgi:hypothetical protein
MEQILALQGIPTSDSAQHDLVISDGSMLDCDRDSALSGGGCH